jgi:hypothetical protein
MGSLRTLEADRVLLMQIPVEHLKFGKRQGCEDLARAWRFIEELLTSLDPANPQTFGPTLGAAFNTTLDSVFGFQFLGYGHGVLLKFRV